ncbi:MAG: alkaline phosphatase family protein [Gammaproteobacteria bacterium]|nr:alkaline phosphatase family protein [Gammaproteobacteria bacterium]
MRVSFLLALVIAGSPVVSQASNWLPLPSGAISKIAFGSCTRRLANHSIFNAVVEASPDLFLHLGDAIYPDVNDEETALLEPWPTPDSLPRIEASYAEAAARDGYTRLRESVPTMAIWDDHDYGVNDGEGDFEYKEAAQSLFLDFYGDPAGSWRRSTPGIYDSRVFGPEGQRVQVILLDVRYFRSTPLADTRSDDEKKALNIAGRYMASRDSEATVIGDAQWAWLEAQFREPAEVRLIVSGYPVVPTELGRDAWGNFPRERQRLFDLIGETAADGVVFLSGDVHFAEISQSDEGPYPMIDFTSSPLAAPSVGNESLANSRRISDTYSDYNFGLIEIDWEAEPAPMVTLRLLDRQAEEVLHHEIALRILAVEK